MKKIWKSLVSLLSAVVLLLAVFAPAFETFAVTLSLNKTGIVLVVGQSYTLKFNKSVKSAKWASSDKKIAAVSQKGVVKGIKKGSAVVSAKVGKKVYKCKVAVESPKISLSNATVKAGKTFTLKLNGTKRTPKWYTSDKKIATVGANGVVKTLKPGTVNVFARLGGKNYVCKLTVTKAGSGVLKSLKYKMITKKFDYKTSSGILYYTNEITYPYFLGSSQVDKKFNSYYGKKVKQYSKANITELEKQYDFENRYNNYILNCLPFYQKTHAEVKYNKNGYISILEDVVDWAGGAHPYTSYNGMTFRISDGKSMKYDSLVRGTDYEKSLLAIMTVRKENLSEGYGIYENDEWIEYTPFVLTNKGLVFYYYMGGSVSGLPLTMPYSSLNTPIINAKKSTDILSKEIEKINNSRIDLAQYLNYDIDVAAKKIGGLNKKNESEYVEYENDYVLIRSFIGNKKIYMINLKGGNSYSLFGAYPGENDIDAYISWESKGFVRNEYGQWRKGNITVSAYTDNYTLGYIYCFRDN